MNTIKYHFHRESAVHTLLEEAAYSASHLTSTWHKLLKTISECKGKMWGSGGARGPDNYEPLKKFVVTPTCLSIH